MVNMPTNKKLTNKKAPWKNKSTNKIKTHMETHFNTCILPFITYLNLSGKKKFAKINSFLHLKTGILLILRKTPFSRSFFS